MKHCNECKTDKPADQFHKRAASIDGLSAKCKPCQKTYDKSRANNPSRVKAREDYAKTDRGMDATKRAKKAWADRNKENILIGTRKYRAENPNKTKAHGMVGYAIKCGKLIEEPCEVCGEVDHVHAHHDDYAKPMSIRWLCSVHHKQWHSDNGPGING